MISNDLVCPRCAAPLRLSERRSRRAGKLIYDCRECEKRFSLRAAGSGLVEEVRLEDSGAATQRLRALRRPQGREKLAEVRAPSESGGLPDGLAVSFDVSDGPDRGRSLIVAHSRCVIGREEGDVQIPDPLISRRHALVEIFDIDTIILKDLASTNGTFHNGRLIDHAKLQDGDEVRLGSTILSVVVDRAVEA
ncbi:MAG TPA: FHA domain-containing protein [Verrucomicrobiae bacterium]|nr:FHA domain-containing protein [Verrucomicrobiae bacterium]